MSDTTTLQLADRCVMCGLCIPGCPTYQLAQSENESPRGRVSLIQGLLRQQLSPDTALLQHLDHCLQCRACERSCPSGVPFGRLMDAVRGELAAQHLLRQPWGLRLMLRQLGARPGGLPRRQRWLYRYQWLGVPRLLALLGYLGSSTLRRLHRLLPPDLERPARPIVLHAADSHLPVQGRVSLFSGCASRLFDQQTQRASVFLLNRLGYAVSIPPRQVCCGALHQHEGQSRAAQALAAQNIEAFGPRQQGPILSIASGCSSHLASYPQLADGHSNGFAQRVEDITAFLAKAQWPEQLHFAPLSARVLVHEPCLQRNVLRQAPAIYQLLRRIPGLEPEPLHGNELCCGAAGSHMLSQPQQADALLAPKLTAVRQQQANLLVTTNIGCALHIQAGLRAEGQLIEVIHPVTLLARQLRTA